MPIRRDRDNLAMVYVTPEAYQAMKVQAKVEGRNMKFLLSRLIMEYVNSNKEGRQHP